MAIDTDGYDRQTTILTAIAAAAVIALIAVVAFVPSGSDSTSTSSNGVSDTPSPTDTVPRTTPPLPQ